MISDNTREQVLRIIAECDRRKDSGEQSDQLVRDFQWKYWAHMCPGEPDMTHERKAAGLKVFTGLDEFRAALVSMITDNRPGEK